MFFNVQDWSLRVAPEFERTGHSGREALTIIFEKFWFLCLRVAALAYVDAYTMLKVFL